MKRQTKQQPLTWFSVSPSPTMFRKPGLIWNMECVVLKKCNAESEFGPPVDTWHWHNYVAQDLVGLNLPFTYIVGACDHHSMCIACAFMLTVCDDA